MCPSPARRFARLFPTYPVAPVIKIFMQHREFEEVQNKKIFVR
jgi:hypothetical protein